MISAVNCGFGLVPSECGINRESVSRLGNLPPSIRLLLFQDRAARLAAFCHTTIATAASAQRQFARGLHTLDRCWLFCRWPYPIHGVSAHHPEADAWCCKPESPYSGPVTSAPEGSGCVQAREYPLNADLSLLDIHSP